MKRSKYLTMLGKGIIFIGASLACKIVDLSRLGSKAHYYQNEIVFFYLLYLNLVCFYKTMI